MPKFVLAVAGKSYSYISPSLDWARGKVSLLDGACGKLETIVTPVINTADKCIDISVDTVSLKVTAVRTSVGIRVAPVQAKLGQVQGAILVRSHEFVDSSESLIDRLLPLPSQALKTKSEQEEKQAKVEVLSRVARLPFAVPVRVTMMVYVKANGAVEAVVLGGRQFANVAMDKQNQFTQAVTQRVKPLTDKVLLRVKPVTDKVSSITTPATRRVRAGKDSAVQTLSDGRQMVTVRVNDVVVRLHLIEVKDWSLERATNFKDSTCSVVTAVVQTAHGTTTRMIGHQRATTLFTKLHLPVEIKLAVESPKAAKVETIAKVESAPQRVDILMPSGKVKTVAKTASKVVETTAAKFESKVETVATSIEEKLSNVTKSIVVADAELEGAIAG